MTDDLAAEWFLALWHQAPTPAKARKLRESTLAKLLKQHRIRRLDAAAVAAILHEKPLTVAPGVTEAASAHIRLLIKRLRLVNEQLKAAHRELDALCDRLQPKAERLSSSATWRSYAPSRETEGSTSPRCSERLGNLCRDEIIMFCEL